MSCSTLESSSVGSESQLLIPCPESGSGLADIQFGEVSDATVADIVSRSSMNSQGTRERIPHITARDWTLDSLLARSERFRSVPRVAASSLLSLKEQEARIAQFEKDGFPLIIEGYHKLKGWPQNLFDVDWLLKNGPEAVRTRNVRDWTDGQMGIEEFIKYCRSTPLYATSNESTRLYGKDVDCPKEWRDWLTKDGLLPPALLEGSPNNFLNHLPKAEMVETLMCYLGIGDTFTPAHKDLCASTGHNLMCYTEKSGTSFWFMTESSAAHEVAEYFQGLNQELDLETHAATLDELANAPFTIYIAEQKLGDLVLVPPRSCHQVVNHGGITIKTSWSRMTLDGLTAALYHELPIYRRVCRQETYRVKSIIYHSLLHYTQIIDSPTGSANARISSPSISLPAIGSESRFPTSSSRNITGPGSKKPTIVYLQEKAIRIQVLRCLLGLFDDILVEELHPKHAIFSHIPNTSGSWHGTCDFCGCDIFQSFLECRACVSRTEALAPGDGLIICTFCYVDGRTCKCEQMEPVQRVPFEDLLNRRNGAVRALMKAEQRSIVAELSLSQIFKLQEDGYTKKLSVFEAAVVLQGLRKQACGKRQQRVCTSRRDASHSMTSLSVLYCKKCHSAMCFEHLLDSGIHAATALLQRRRDDPSHDRWHSFHQKNKSRYNKRKVDARKEEEDGKYSRLDDRLVFAAANFTVCKPSNQKWLKLGWYDKFIQGSDPMPKSLPTRIPADTNHSRAPSAFSSPLTEISTLPALADEPASASMSNASHTDQDLDSRDVSSSLVVEETPHRKRTTRLVLDYIEMPLRKRKSSTLSGGTTKKARLAIGPREVIAKSIANILPSPAVNGAQQRSTSSQGVRTSVTTQSLTTGLTQRKAVKQELTRRDPPASSRSQSGTSERQRLSARCVEPIERGIRKRGHPDVRDKSPATPSSHVRSRDHDSPALPEALQTPQAATSSDQQSLARTDDLGVEISSSEVNRESPRATHSQSIVGPSSQSQMLDANSQQVSLPNNATSFKDMATSTDAVPMSSSATSLTESNLVKRIQSVERQVHDNRDDLSHYRDVVYKLRGDICRLSADTKTQIDSSRRQSDLTANAMEEMVQTHSQSMADMEQRHAKLVAEMEQGNSRLMVEIQKLEETYKAKIDTLEQRLESVHNQQKELLERGTVNTGITSVVAHSFPSQIVFQTDAGPPYPFPQFRQPVQSYPPRGDGLSSVSHHRSYNRRGGHSYHHSTGGFRDTRRQSFHRPVQHNNRSYPHGRSDNTGRRYWDDEPEVIASKRYHDHPEDRQSNRYRGDSARSSERVRRAGWDTTKSPRECSAELEERPAVPEQRSAELEQRSAVPGQLPPELEQRSTEPRSPRPSSPIRDEARNTLSVMQDGRSSLDENWEDDYAPDDVAATPSSSKRLLVSSQGDTRSGQAQKDKSGRIRGERHDDLHYFNPWQS